MDFVKFLTFLSNSNKKNLVGANYFFEKMDGTIYFYLHIGYETVFDNIIKSSISSTTH